VSLVSVLNVVGISSIKDIENWRNDKMKIKVGNGKKIHLAHIMFKEHITGTICGAGNQGISTRFRSRWIKVPEDTKITCNRCLKLKEK
jgi:hypothetical protein